MLIGAYRDNEVDSAHPLSAGWTRSAKRGGVRAGDQLAPLAPEDLKQLIADALRCTPDVPRRWRNWWTRRRVAIRFSPFSSFPRSPKRNCSASMATRRAGSWELNAFTPRGIPTMLRTLWSGS